MNYKQVYRRHEMKPQMLISPGGSSRKAFSVHKNMESGGLGPAAGYYFDRVERELRAHQRREPFGTFSSPELHPKPAFSQLSQSSEQPFFPPLKQARRSDPSLQQPSQAEPQRENPQLDSEIERLREELRKKDEELAKYQPRRIAYEPKQKARSLPEESESFDRNNKALWDKQVSREARKLTVEALNYQLSEKEMQRQWDTLQKEKEQMTRLEHLRRLREVEAQERLTQVSRAKVYREHLDMQRKIKSELSYQEMKRARMSLPAETAPPARDAPLRRSYQPQSEFEKVALEFYDQTTDSLTATSLTPFRLTKKAPKTITFNPITGIVRDTSIYLHDRAARPVLRSYLPEPRNQDHFVPEYSQLPAFQQPSFTAKNPKVFQTDPITMKLPPRNYRTEEFYADAAKFFGVDDPAAKSAEVGS